MSAPKRPLLLLLLAIFAIACGSTLPAPGSGSPLSLPDLKYAVIDKAGSPYICGPPVARVGYEEEQAAAQFPAIKADAETYRAIIARAHPAGSESDPAYQLVVWREWEKLQATQLTASANGGSDFSVRTATATVAGTVDSTGKVSVTSTKPGRPNCPICLAAATLIATPSGPVRVTDLKVGDEVWTATASGRRLAGRVTALGSVAFPLGHDAIRVQLSDGRAVTASAGHPTADGRSVGDLRTGDRLDGATVVAATPVHLTDGATYDLLPSGPTGSYWADGVLLGSTLR
ncbi:MAG TPA: Hint domain-containing protein [Candidatus Dormibacteraeota bacterium]